IESVRHVHIMMFCECRRCQCDEWYSLVRGSEEHVVLDAGCSNRRCVIAPELCRCVAGAEQAGVEKVRTHTSGFQRELAEAKDAQLQCKVEKFLFICTHVGLGCSFCIIAR